MTAEDITLLSVANGPRGRDEMGRFLTGHGVRSPGRPRRVAEAEIHAALDAAMPPAEVIERVAQAVRAREPWAIQLWLAYRWGRPVERVDADVYGVGVGLLGLLQDVHASLPQAEDVPALPPAPSE